MPLIYVDTLEDPRLDAFARLTEAQLAEVDGIFESFIRQMENEDGEEKA